MANELSERICCDGEWGKFITILISMTKENGILLQSQNLIYLQNDLTGFIRREP